jgi:twinkle protein
MNKTFLRNEPCEECGSSSGVGVFLDNDDSEFKYCYACNQVISKGDGEALNNSYSISNASINNLSSRRISKQACVKYEVLSEVENGKDIVHYYPHTINGETVSYMVRVLPKSFSQISIKDSLKGTEFFGQKQCGNGGKMIIVTEGQLDTLASFDMLKAEGKSYRVCSIINGASSAVKCFKDNYEWINSFDNIFLVFDQDDPGKEAAEKVVTLFEPGKVKVVSISEKDANDMLVAGKSKEFLQAIFNAKAGKIEGIVSVDDIFEEAIKPPEVGKSYPWKTLNDVTFGYRTKELIGIGAGSGCGKTELMKELINNTIHNHNEVAGVIFLEEPVTKTLKVLAGKKLNKRFHIPSEHGGDWTIDELTTGINELKGKVYLYNHFGAKNWESIEGKIRYMVNALGIKDIYLDHLTALVAQEDNEYKALNKIMEELASLVQELDCTIFYVSHLRKNTSTPHEEGGHVSADQFKGSGAIVYWSNFLFGLERNQIAEDVDERNTTTFRVLKDRNTGLATGVTFKLRYDHSTGRWDEFNPEEFNDEDFDEDSLD